ncbi:MAG: hypothetical protein IJX23_02240, partial [Clostridia bacterium]|nr:hypothetical protein [Clostridia bacterium]
GETVYTYNPIVNAFTTTFNGSEVYLGTYNDFETISVSNLSYITAENTCVEQFPLELLAAVDGASYTASLKQVKLEGKTLYLDGGVSGRYLTTTEDATAAATVYAEKVAGGFKFYILDGETKKYINLYNNTDNKLSVNYDENGTSVFAYNATVNAWVTIFSETEYYLGTYNDFNTVSASKLSYITAENTGVEQFPLEYNPVVSSHECTSVCDKCGKCTNADCQETVCSEKCTGHQHFTTIEGALTGKKLDTATFTGTVSEIYAEWDEGYGNMSFYVSDGTNQILVFRTTTKANIGDTVTVSGTIDVYNDVPQIAKGSTVTIASQGGGETPAECTNLCETCGKCLDEDCTQHTEKCNCEPEAITTIAGALAAADGAAVELTGTVTGHNGGFKSNFYIEDEAGNSIYVYYATSDVNIGDVVKVVGKVGSYNGAKQIAKGSTVTIVTPHTCVWADATCEKPAKCTVCDAEKGEALGHTYVEGVCSVCGEAEPAAGT